MLTGPFTTRFKMAIRFYLLKAYGCTTQPLPGNIWGNAQACDYETYAMVLSHEFGLNMDRDVQKREVPTWCLGPWGRHASTEAALMGDSEVFPTLLSISAP
jgi:hypothetical protein